MALKRLMKDLKELQSGTYTHFSATPRVTQEVTTEGTVDEATDWFKWDAVIFGPSDTPYEGGIFKLQIDIPTQYPYRAPSCMFLTKVYHPNIGASGLICLDILKTQWSPALGITKTLLSILSLLSDPNPSDPYNPEAGKLYMRDKTAFDIVAREWTDQYAK